jgi:hypothetical protein
MPRTFGPVDFVAADGHEVTLELVDIHRHLAHSLGCVRVEKDLSANVRRKVMI